MNATILFGTDTFLAGYARVADNYDFYSVRYVFAGAERVKAETRRVWFEKFGIRILEGYGATETAPALAVNTPMHFKAGHGRPAAAGHRASPRAGRGHRRRRPAVRARPQRDARLPARRSARRARAARRTAGTTPATSSSIDAEGFVTIKGRAKRFAKVAGEMVPLGAVEDFVARVWPDGACTRSWPCPTPSAASSWCSSPSRRDASAAGARRRRARGGPARDLRAARDRARAAGADPRHRQDRLRRRRPPRVRARPRIVRGEGEKASGAAKGRALRTREKSGARVSALATHQGEGEGRTRRRRG